MLPPWQAQQPIFDRVIAVHRSRNVSTAPSNAKQTGVVGYSGREDNLSSSDLQGEIVLQSNVPANIQFKRHGRTRGTLLPSDTVDSPVWSIAIAASSLPQYSVRDRDIIIDDEGYRYEVAGNYWTQLGYQLECIRLEV